MLVGWWQTILLVMVCGPHCESWQPEGWTWNFVDVHSTFVPISDISPDLGMPGYLIFTQPTSLNTTNGNEWRLLAGGDSQYGFRNGPAELARFRSISSFVQPSSKRVLLADRFNHCIRELNRETGLVSNYIGKCELTGFKDGESRTALFSEPQDLELNKDHLYVADFRNHVIRVVDMAAKIVSTAVPSSSGIHLPLGVVSGHSKLHVSNLLGVVEFSMDSANEISPTAKELYSGTGPQKLLMLGPDHLAIARCGNNSVILVNLTTNQTTKICNGKGRAWIDGRADNCKLYGPTSLAYMDGVLYIGGMGGIRGIRLTTEDGDSSFHFSRSTVIDKRIIIACGCLLIIIIIVAVTLGILRCRRSGVSMASDVPAEMEEMIILNPASQASPDSSHSPPKKIRKIKRKRQ